MGAIEIALCDFTPAGGKWSEPLNTKDAVAIRRLLTLLRSRYGTMPDALRQLALLFSLLPPGAQPTDAIEQQSIAIALTSLSHKGTGNAGFGESFGITRNNAALADRRQSLATSKIADRELVQPVV